MPDNRIMGKYFLILLILFSGCLPKEDEKITVPESSFTKSYEKKESYNAYSPNTAIYSPKVDSSQENNLTKEERQERAMMAVADGPAQLTPSTISPKKNSNGEIYTSSFEDNVQDCGQPAGNPMVLNILVDNQKKFSLPLKHQCLNLSLFRLIYKV